MTRHQLPMLVGLGMILPVGLQAGCWRAPSPSEEAIIEYLRNARVHGKVRRAWPEGQKYVDSVLNADAKLQKELDLLREYTATDALWPQADPRWQDEVAIAAAVESLTDLCEGRKGRRQLLLRELGRAIDQAPQGLQHETDADKASFADRVWWALSIMDANLRSGFVIRDLEAVAEAHLNLTRLVQGCEGAFDTDRPGLNITDAREQKGLDAHHGALRHRLDLRREAFLDHAESVLSGMAPLLRTVDKRRNRGDYEYFTYRSAYLKGELRAIVKRLQAATAQTTAELEQLQAEVARADEEARPCIAAEITAAQERLARYQADLEMWEPRVKAAVAQFESASRREAAAAGGE